MNVYFLLVFCAPIGYFILEYGLDRIRIQRHLKQYQCQLTTLKRQFTNWPLTLFIKKRQREYHILYKDKLGQELAAVCHTEMFEGVFWTSGSFPKETSFTPKADLTSLQKEFQTLQQKIQNKKLAHQEHKLRLENEIQALEEQLARFRS